MSNVLGLRMLLLEGSVSMWWRRDSHLRGRLLSISVSLSSILGINEKIEQHIRKKTHKPNALRFWVEVASFPYMGLAQFSFL